MSRFVLSLVLLGACNSADSQHAVVTLDTVPALDITDKSLTDGGAIEFPAAATRLSNGNIAVNDSWGGRLLFFDPQGNLIRAIGRKGSGPGEFNVLVWRGVCAADSVYAATDALREWVIDSAGHIIRDAFADMSENYLACNRQGVKVYVQNEPLTHAPRSNDPPMRGEVFVGENHKRRASLGSFTVWEYGPTRPQLRMAMSDDEVFLGSGESGEVKVFSITGKHLRDVDTGARRRAPSDAEYEASLDAMVSVMTDRATREQNKTMLRERFPKPKQAAAFRALTASPNGLLWITASMPGNGRTLLHVIAKDGSISRLTLPVELRIFEVGDDYVLGTYQDDEGFPHVVLYHYSRGDGGE